MAATHRPSGDAALDEIVPTDLGELLRSHTLRLQRPVWGGRYGRHASLRAGLGLEFRDHRAYSPGDDPRQLDWRAVARRERLVLRQTDAEDELRTVIVLDAGANLGYGTGSQQKFFAARALALALTWTAVRQGDGVGFVLAHEGDLDTTLLRPARGHTRLQAIARRVHDLAPAGRTPLRSLIPTLAPRLPRRSLLVVISDFLDPSETFDDAAAVEGELLGGLARVRARHHDVLLLQVLHRDELEFPWGRGDQLRFVDPRGLRPPVEGTGSSLRAAYLERLRQHLHGLERQCEGQGLFLQRVVTDEALGTSFSALIGRLAGTGQASIGAAIQ